MQAASIVVALLAVSFGVAGCRSKPVESSSDRVVPTPSELPYLAVKLPPSARDYYAHESGMQHTMLQLRFEIAAAELPLFEKRLPCRLGPVQTGAPDHGTVGTNDRSWYQPELAKKHRGCEHLPTGIRTASFLVDVGNVDRAIVYAVISSE